MLRDIVDIYAEFAAIERARSQAKSPTVLPDPRNVLHPAQLPIYDCTAQERAVMAGRRFGKSVLLCAAALQAAMRFPNDPDVQVPYIVRTKSNARRDVWPILKRVLWMLGLKAKTNESTLECAPHAGGARVVLGGCETKADIDLWRGPKVARAIIDECGAYPDDVLVGLCEVLEPGLADVGGDVWKAGTPGYIFDGHWFELTGHLAFPQLGKSRAKIPVFHGDMFQNPHMYGGDSQALRRYAETVREKYGWDEDSPAYVREWRGLWVRSLEGLVYQYMPERNGVTLEDLPAPLDHEGWRYVIGVDPGQTEELGIVVTGAHKWSPDMYALHAEKAPGMLTQELAQRIRMLWETYRKAEVVMDTGGIGKQHAEEVRRRFGIPVIPAEKTDRASAVRLLSDDVRSGHVKVLDGEQCDELRSEWGVIRWDQWGRDHEPQQLDPKTGRRRKLDHCSDGAIYAFRRQRHYSHTANVEPPKPGTDAWARAERDRMREARLKAIKRRDSGTNGRPKWDS